MRRALALAALPALLIAGCATDRKVTVEVPYSRMELPEPANRMLGIGVGGQSTVRAELTADQTTTSPDPDHPKLENKSSGQLRFDWLASPQFEFSLRNWGADIVGGQFKWYALQPVKDSALSLAMTAGFGSARSHFDYDPDPAAHTTLRQTLADFGLVLGLRADRQTLVFGGPYLSRNSYKGHYFSTRGSNPDVENDFEGHINITGANFGLAWTPRDWVTVAGEVSFASVKAGAVNDNPVGGTLLAHFWFGPRERSPEAREPPVVVVPVEEPKKESP